MFDLCWIDLAVFPGKRHICPVVLCRIDMSCVDGDRLVETLDWHAFVTDWNRIEYWWIGDGLAMGWRRSGLAIYLLDWCSCCAQLT